MAFSEQDLNELKAAVKIDEVIGRHVSLRRNGGTLKGLCPFHDEKSPSFTVDTKKNIYKCFGCGKSGDSISFVMEIDRIDFVSAVKLLADSYSIPMGGSNMPPIIHKLIVKKETASSNLQHKEFGFGEIIEFTAADIAIWFGEKVIQFYKATFKDAYLDELRNKLKQLNWVRVESYWRVNEKLEKLSFFETENCPIYIRREQTKTGDFAKVYCPKVSDKSFKFSYLGTKPESYVNGFALISKKLKEIEAAELAESANTDETSTPIEKPAVFLTCGERDAANLWAFGYYPVWLNSETAILDKDTLYYLISKCSAVYNIPDLDATGQEQMHKLSMREEDDNYLRIKNVMLPKELRTMRGGKCKDLRDYFDFFPRRHFDKLVANALPYQFWSLVIRKEAEVAEINGSALLEFLQNNGFYKFKMSEESDEFFFIHIQGNIVKRVEPSEIKAFVIDFLKKRQFPIKVRNRCLYSPTLSPAALENLELKSLDFRSYGIDYQFIFFKNEAWKITKDGIEKHRGRSSDKVVWNDKVIDLDVKLYAEPMVTVKGNTLENIDIIISEKAKQSYFFRYLWNTCRMYWREEVTRPLTDEEIQTQKLHLINKLFAIGYLLHRYKFMHRGWFVFAMEQALTTEGESQGGTGKSIFFEALKKILRITPINGRDGKALDSPHVFENVSEHTDIVFFDEMKDYFPIQKYFSFVTAEMHVNPKGKRQISIPFETAPKMAGASNYPLRNIDGSTQRRILYIAFSDYYHSENVRTGEAERNVRQDLGIELFRDFSRDDWSDFYNLMANALQIYLLDPIGEKINPPMGNIQHKNMSSTIGENFLEWAEVKFSAGSPYLDCYLIRQELQASFYEDTKQKITPASFKRKLELFCIFKHLRLNPSELLQKDGRIVKTIDGKPAEVFYLQSANEKGEPIPYSDKITRIELRNRNTYQEQNATELSPVEREGLPF